MLQCGHCEKQFKYESERLRHELSHEPRFQCDVCQKKFSFQSALRRHQKQHERVGSVPCDRCSRSFRDETLLKRHIKYSHKGTYICKKCSAKFSSDLALRTHEKTHNLESERKYKCSFDGCGKTFNFRHHLKHHELTHTNTKPHYCVECGKGFIQAHHLKTHLKTHQADKSLFCPVSSCKKKLSTEYARKRHIATHKSSVDSGISDSNSTSDSINSEDFKEDEKQLLDCKEYTSVKNDINQHYDANTDIYNHNSLIKGDFDSHNADNTVSNCKSAIGDCIVDDKRMNSGCLCAQLSCSNNNYSDFEIPEDKSNNLTKSPPPKMLNTSIEPVNRNMCEGCDCSVAPKPQIINYAIPETKETKCSKDNMPEIEYRIDGTVKLKETFDVDIPKVSSEPEKQKKIFINIPFNSCKAVLGRCIVSDNGTIDEGCLCAKMALDEQQMTAEEIDEITPQPSYANMYPSVI